MSIEFFGKVKDSQLWLPRQQVQLRQHFLSQIEGKAVYETLRKAGPSKSLNQVKAHFGLAVQLIRERMIELGWGIAGVEPNKEFIHEILTKCCGGVGEDGAVVRLSDMTTSQAAAFFDNIRTWSATQLNLCIPDPDPAWKEKQ
uniref:Uncharacterized protein n=1 Tax=viral metagenome TaxID=1070528 RepID=A0A6M3JC02_9ZZZZ